jgi:hypothetical protein
MAQPTKEEIIAELQRREGIEKELSSRLPQTQQMQPETQGYMQRLMQMPGGQALSRAGQAISGLGDIGFIKGLGYSFPRQVQERVGGIQQFLGGQPKELPAETPTTSFGETLGRGVGSLAGDITAAAPFVIGTMAALPEMAVAAPILGAGLAGGLEKKGGYGERALSSIEDMLMTAGGLAIKPVARLTKASFKTPTSGKVGEILLKNYNKAHDYATGLLEQAGLEAKKLGIDVLKTGKGTPLDKNFWNELAPKLEKTEAVRDLVNKAKSGDFDALRRFQSYLGGRARKLNGSQNVAEQDMGKVVSQQRDKINNYIEEHFNKSGVESIAKKIREGMSKYRDLMETYSDPLVSKAVGPDEKISKSLLEKTMESSKSMKKLRAANPELKPIHQLVEDKETLKKLGISGGSVLPSFAALKYLLGGKQQPQNEFEQ